MVRRIGGDVMGSGDIEKVALMTKVYSSDLILNTSFVSTGEVKEVMERVLGCYRS